MLLLALGLILFVAIHLVPTRVELRGALVTSFGEPAYKIGFAILSLAGLTLIAIGYHKLQLMPGKNPQIWNPPVWTRHVVFTLMLPAMILLVATYVPSRIRTSIGHPMLAAVKIWAAAHLLANGDLGSIVLFGSILAWAVVDRISVKRRNATGPIKETKPTSILNDIAVVTVGMGLYMVMLMWGHRVLIGVPLVP